MKAKLPSVLALFCLLPLWQAVVIAAPLKVYILAGQSNMQGHASVSTFDSLARDPETAALLARMRGEDGEPTVCERVWISSLSEGRGGDPVVKQGQLTVGFGAGDDRIGPEFTFGLTVEEHVDGPILLIKTAWGGKSLHTDFRPPSASEEGAGASYQQMVEHVKAVLADPGAVVPGHEAGDGYELGGFVWFQGWNDMVDGGAYPDRNQPGGYDRYTDYLAHLIRDVRRDLDAPELPFVIGVMGVGGPTELYESPRYQGVHQNFRDAMAAPAAMPEFEGRVVAVLTEQFWDHELAAVRAKKREEWTAAEEEIARGISNQEFHYLGAAKILGPIGKAFAEALIGLE
jgi:hypothetical protein